MLTESQIHKENDDVTLENNPVSDDDNFHEHVEVNIVVACGGGVNNHDEKLKFSLKGKKDQAVEDMGENLRHCVKMWQDVSNYVNEKDGVIKKDDYEEVIMDATTYINNMEDVNLEENENMMIVHIHVEDTVV
ncbi:unnamed protein product [Vicia faba]|uniref:Uncharacterized protein n=1 Tax=Vicia faba TaxID=3906 RepID=A0AAV1B8T9_VICFA|nr:unnamed protein product [Vicia faba]